MGGGEGGERSGWERSETEEGRPIWERSEIKEEAHLCSSVLLSSPLRCGCQRGRSRVPQRGWNTLELGVKCQDRVCRVGVTQGDQEPLDNSRDLCTHLMETKYIYTHDDRSNKESESVVLEVKKREIGGKKRRRKNSHQGVKKVILASYNKIKSWGNGLTSTIRGGGLSPRVGTGNSDKEGPRACLGHHAKAKTHRPWSGHPEPVGLDRAPA
ncbi:hypothetical protein Sjap_003302 [Stephania japonica]|uniref:Uncharacterized protein n=1 Tax=Stephania japonica TaxID=461633 RepID=A0AAP0KQL2_9MAGN